MDSKSYFVLNIMEYLGTPAEKDLTTFKEQFKCPINKDIEDFLKNSATIFAKKHQAISYLVFSQRNGAFLGYFIPAYLIAQLGKNFQSGLNDSITGNDLLALAMEQISLIQYKVGGILCVLECEQKKGLLDFYCEQNHFVEFGKRNTKSTNKSLLQLLKTI